MRTGPFGLLRSQISPANATPLMVPRIGARGPRAMASVDRKAQAASSGTRRSCKQRFATQERLGTAARALTRSRYRGSSTSDTKEDDPRARILCLPRAEFGSCHIGSFSEPQSNGIVERLHRTLLDEHVEGRRTWFETIEEMQAVLDTYLHGYNHTRPHQGSGMHGRTRHQAFIDGSGTAAKENHAKTPNDKKAA